MTSPTLSDDAQDEMRAVAFGYAYGRQDTGLGKTYLDPRDFADHWLQLGHNDWTQLQATYNEMLAARNG